MISKNVIWLNGMPRSGTSWLSQIFDSNPVVSFKLSPLFSYAFKNYVDKDSSKEEWIKLFTNIFYSEDDFINQTYRRDAGEYPVFKKEELSRLVIKDTRYHNLTERLLELFSDIKIIHIIRHPGGAINSWLKAAKEFPQHLNPLEEWRTAQCRKQSPEEFWGFNDWLSLTKKYLKLEKKYPNNVMVVYYEEMVHDSKLIVQKMFDFVELDLAEQTVSFLEKSQSSHQEGEYAVFKSKLVVDKWKGELHPAIIEEINQELKSNQLDHLFNE